MPSYVYLLVHAEKPKFKIGVGNDPLIRSKQLSQEIDYSNSCAYMFDERGRAFDIETILHRLFKSEAQPEPRSEVGFSEWFSIGALPKVVSFLEAHKMLTGHKEVCTLAPAPRVRKMAMQSNEKEMISGKVNWGFSIREYRASLQDTYFALKDKIQQIKILNSELSVAIIVDDDNESKDPWRTYRNIVAYGDDAKVTKVHKLWNQVEQTAYMKFLLVYDKEITAQMKQRVKLTDTRRFKCDNINLHPVYYESRERDTAGVGLSSWMISYDTLRSILEYGSPTPYAEEIASLFLSFIEGRPLGT